MPTTIESVPEATPRKTRLSAYIATADAILLACGSLWLAVGSGLVSGLALFQNDAWDDLVLMFRGVAAQAVPVGVLPTDTILRGRAVEEIRFRFADRKGSVRWGRSRSADPDLLRRARFGAPLPIHYDPARPARARVDGARASPLGFFAALPLVLTLAGLVALALSLARIGRLRRVLVWGRRAVGRVVGVEVSESPFRRRRAFDVRYAFEVNGEEMQGVSAAAEAPRPGVEVAVLYDAERPSRSALPDPGAFPG